MIKVSEPNLIFVSEGEEIQRFKLTKRILKLGEAARTVRRKKEPLKLPASSKKSSSKGTRGRTNDNEGVNTEWTKKDKDSVRNTLISKGIPLTSEGRRDWETFRLNLKFSERSSEEVRDYVEGYLRDCRGTIEAAGKHKKEGKKNDLSDTEDAGASLKIPPQTADKVLKHVDALEQIRKMFFHCNSIVKDIFSPF